MARQAKTLTVNLGHGVTLELVLIPAGSFTMGSDYGIDAKRPPYDMTEVQRRELLEEAFGRTPPYEGWKEDWSALMGRIFGNETPPHLVTITKPFYLGKYEVTQEQWAAVMNEIPSVAQMGEKLPIHDVSWDDCQQFLELLNQKVPAISAVLHSKSRRNDAPIWQRKGRRLKFSLPTEAQWEYACRAGSKTDYCFGDNPEGLVDYGWVDESAKELSVESVPLQAVGQKRPNHWGLYDMYGNVQELCEDWYGSYTPGRKADPTGPLSELLVQSYLPGKTIVISGTGAYHESEGVAHGVSGRGHVLRGGSCSLPAVLCRSASRYAANDGITGERGFRVAVLLP